MLWFWSEFVVENYILGAPQAEILPFSRSKLGIWNEFASFFDDSLKKLPKFSEYFEEHFGKISQNGKIWKFPHFKLDKTCRARSPEGLLVCWLTSAHLQLYSHMNLSSDFWKMFENVTLWTLFGFRFGAFHPSYLRFADLKTGPKNRDRTNEQTNEQTNGRTYIEILGSPTQ